MELLIVFGIALLGNAVWFAIARRRTRKQFARQLVTVIKTERRAHVPQISEEDEMERARR